MVSSKFLNIVKPSEPCPAYPPSNIATQFKHPLDPFQQHAVVAISRDENVLVTAKTGSGKTLVGEYQIAHSLAKGGRVFYTTPIKSLSNQKFHDLKEMFPSVGIMTGDLKFRPDAQIVIMTTEILRNLLFKQNSSSTRALGITSELSIDGLDAVVFDECHYINDRDRGAVWEETMILLPSQVNLVLLSATIDSPEIFAAWLGDLKKRPIHLISTQYRIVPLYHSLYRSGSLTTIMDNKEQFEAGLYNGWLKWRTGQAKAADEHKARVADRRRGGYDDGPVARHALTPKAYTHQMNELVGYLEKEGLLPALFFVFSRKDCERYAALVEHTLIDSSDTASVKHILDFHLHRYGDTLKQLPQYHTLRSLLEKGIAFHHSGLLPVLKEIVEILFGRGLIKLLFATETFAVGINMPTKTVVFTGYRKYDDMTGGMRLLNTDEYIQMAGRAGRRGKDDKGIVIYLPNREPESLEDVKRMMTGARATFQSRMTFHYDFLLKTMQAGNLDWLDLMHQSYWYRRHEMQLAACKRDIEALEREIAGLGISPADIETMQERDVLAATLKNSVNAARREAQKAWSAWENAHSGAHWTGLIKEAWPKWARLTEELAETRAWFEHESDPSKPVIPSFEVLSRLGLLEEGAAEGTHHKMTQLGTMATEVNEGHPILMTLAYRDGLYKDLTAEEVLVFLTAFMGEGGGDAGEPLTLEGQAISQKVKTALRKVEEIAAACEKVEGEVGALRAPKDSYWMLNLSCMEPIRRWLEGATMAEIAGTYAIYEGNMMRLLLKLVNLLEELRSIATIAADIDLLEKMRGMEDVVLRDIAVSDSLYLRI